MRVSRFVHLFPALALAAVALAAPSAASAATAKVGSVFTDTNDPAGNQIAAFDRFSDGTLGPAQLIDTGGVGAPSPFNCLFPPSSPPCSITDSSGAVNLTSDGRLLFAVNPGSNTISSFRVTSRGTTLVDQVASGGVHPVSLDTHDRLLYVLNQSSGNIAGFSFSPSGHLVPIPGSVQPLATPGPGATPAQVGFDKTGRKLTVSEVFTGLIDTFVVTGGVAGPVISQAAASPGPFGFAYDPLNLLVLSEAGVPPFFPGHLSTYAQALGPLSLIDTTPTQGSAPCWVAITPSGRYVFVANLLTKDISRFRLENGKLTLLGKTATPTSPNLQPGTTIGVSADLAMSIDGRFLYQAIPSGFGGATSRVDAYRIGSTGDLGFLQSTPEVLAAGLSGMAAR